MKTSKKRSKRVHVVDGVARDQETILSQKPWIEDYVRENVSDFSKSKVIWEMNGDGNFSFKMHFYA